MKDMNEDWVECNLGDLLKLKNGFAFKSSTYSPEGIPVLRIGDIQDWNVNAENANRIKEHKDYDFHIVNKGDILIAMSGATTGKFGIYNSDEKAYQNQRVGNLIPHSSKFTIKKYIYFLLYSLKYEIEKGAYGGAQPNISATKIEALNTILFPLPIQKAIVRKIEELFSSLDSGIADLKKAQEQLVIYRQAVLKKAFEGKYDKIKLEDVCEKITKVKRKEMKLNDSLLYLDIGGIDNKTNVILSHKVYTWKDAPSRAQQIVKVGDVLFSTVRTYLKNIAQVINPIYNNEIASSGFTVIRGKEELLNPKFMFFISTSQFFLEPLNKLQRGSSYPAVRDKDVLSQLIPLPTLQEQKKIVQEIESRLSVCDKVEESIAESLEKAKALRQSILKKAFEGKLLSAAEIARCKQDKDYEPAGVLLERIKREKTKN